MKKLWKETAKKSTVKQAGKYLAATALLSCVMCGTAFAGSWYQGGRGWLYAYDDGRTGQSEWVQDGGRYYRIDDAGLMATGWVMVDGKWYFLDTRSGGPQGAMLTGWQWIDGKCYYLDPAQGGALLVSTTTPDGYTVDANGAWVDANGNPVYEAGRGISTAVSQGSSGFRVGGSGSSGGSGGSGSSGSSGSSGYSDSMWDDYSDSSVSYGANDFETGNYGMMTADQCAEVEDAIQDFIDEYITDNMSDFEKEMVMIQWLVENCKYESGDGWENATAYSCIVNGKAQCAGYADAFLQTAKACGIEARYVYNATHAWNLVELDGDWYHVDVTWEDPIGSSNKYGFGNLRNKYINLEDSRIRGYNSHHTWSPDSISADGTDYGPDVVKEYLESGKIDTSLGESFEDSMDDFFDEAANEDGSNMFEYDGVDGTADQIIKYLERMLDEKAESASFVVRYPDSYSAAVTGNYSKLVDLNNEIEDQVNKEMNEKYKDVLRSDIKISLYLQVDAQSCYYAHESVKFYYQEGQGKKIAYTIHFIDIETGDEVGVQTGTGEKRTSIPLEFPEGYRWITNGSEYYEVNEGEARYSGRSFTILGTTAVDMDVKLRSLNQDTAEKDETEAEETETEEAAEAEETVEAAVVEETAETEETEKPRC